MLLFWPTWQSGIALFSGIKRLKYGESPLVNFFLFVQTLILNMLVYQLKILQIFLSGVGK